MLLARERSREGCVKGVTPIFLDVLYNIKLLTIPHALVPKRPKSHESPKGSKKYQFEISNALPQKGEPLCLVVVVNWCLR